MSHFNNLLFVVKGLKRAGHKLQHEMFFDTLKIHCGVAAKDILERAVQRQINLRVYSEEVVGDHFFPFFVHINHSVVFFKMF